MEMGPEVQIEFYQPERAKGNFRQPAMCELRCRTGNRRNNLESRLG